MGGAGWKEGSAALAGGGREEGAGAGVGVGAAAGAGAEDAGDVGVFPDVAVG
jgi:hypothetical protein